jgi:hypothetical protein
MNRIFESILPAGPFIRSWFRLTREEQQVLAAVLFLFILGMGVRAWRIGNAHGATSAPVTVPSERSAR